jgi:mannose-6-phosphate isomerase
MSQTVLYPLRFEPIYQYRLWGGRRLAGLLSEPLPNNGPIGEAWILSDREDHASRIANGPLKGQNLGQLMEQFHFGHFEPYTYRLRVSNCKNGTACVRQ